MLFQCVVDRNFQKTKMKPGNEHKTCRSAPSERLESKLLLSLSNESIYHRSPRSCRKTLLEFEINRLSEGQPKLFVSFFQFHVNYFLVKNYTISHRPMEGLIDARGCLLIEVLARGRGGGKKELKNIN